MSIRPALRRQYPAARRGGLFLLIVGIAIAAGGFFGKQLMFPSLAVGFAIAFLASATFGRRLAAPLGSLTRIQRLAPRVAIALELLLFLMVYLAFQKELAQGHIRLFIISILLIVAFHFAVFAITFGPLMLLLAALCLVNAVVGLLFSFVPLNLIWMADGLIKVVIGTAMLRSPAPD